MRSHHEFPTDGEGKHRFRVDIGQERMRSHHEFHPDLSDCVLEDRALLALAPGLGPSPFMAFSATTNQIIVPGTSTGGSTGSGGGVSPGPTFYYLRIGASPSGGGSG